MTVQSFARIVRALRPHLLIHAIVWIAACALAQPALSQSVSSKRTETRQGVVGVQLEKNAEWAAPLCPGGNIHYTVRITNIGDLAGTAEIVDPIPANTTYVPGSAGGGAFYHSGGDRIVWEGFLAPGQSQSIGFSVTVDTGFPVAAIFNEATGRVIAGETVAETQVQVETPLECPPLDPVVSKDRQLTDPLCPGATIHYTVRLTNDTARDTILDARIEDPIPDHTTFAGSLSPGASLEGNTVIWEGQLAPGATHALSFSVKVADGAPDGTVITNRATGTLSDPQVGDSEEEVEEVQDTVDCPEGDLSLQIEKDGDAEDPLCPTSTISYEITLTNTSETQELLDARIEDTIPDDTTFENELEPDEARHEDGQVVWEGQLASGESQTVSFDVTVDPGTPDGTEIVNEATGFVSAPGGGPETSAEDRTESVVDCVREVKDAVPTANLELALKYVEFKDNMDDECPIFCRGDGDGYGFAALEIDSLPLTKNPRRVTKLGGCDEWVKSEDGTVQKLGADGISLLGGDGDSVCNEMGEDNGNEELKMPICCTLRDVDLAIDLWENDDSSAVYDKLAQVLIQVGKLLQRPETAAAEAIYNAVKAAGLLKNNPDELGNWDHPNLTTPWAENPERFTCPLQVAVLDGDKDKLLEESQQVRNRPFVDREPDEKEENNLEFLFERRSNLMNNGRFWLEWDTSPRFEESCNELQDDDAEGKEGGHGAPARLSDRATSGGLDLRSVSTLQVSERELDLAWMFEPLAGQPALPDLVRELGTVSLHWTLTTPRTAELAPSSDRAQAWRVVVRLSTEGGQVIAESSVDRWDDSEWLQTGAEALDVTVGERSVAATIDHRDIGELDSYSLSAELLEEGNVVDAVPNDPSREFLLRWGEDVTPPFVTSVRSVPLDVSEGPFGERLPAGSIDEIQVELSERVDLIPGDVRLEPSVEIDVEVDGRLLTIDPRLPVGAGTYELVLSDTIMDTAGNRLDGDDDGQSGGTFRHSLHVVGTRFFSTDRTGEPKNRFLEDEEIFASGFDFDASTALDLYLMPTHRVSAGAPLEDITSDGANPIITGPSGELDPTSIGRATQPGEYTVIADIDRDGRFDEDKDRRWRDAGTGVAVTAEDDEPDPPGEAPDPPAGPWLTSAELPGFEAKVRITPPGGEPIDGAAEPECIVETLCVSGALAGRPEIFAKVIGPRPNGKLWTQIARFTPSRVEVWLRQVATQTVRYYDLERVGRTSDDVSGLQDREAFDPAGAPSTVPRGAVLAGAAVESFDPVRLLPRPLEPGEPQPPGDLEWLADGALPGFRFKARITAAGGQTIAGRRVERCIPETLCIQGALAGRPEVFAKIIGPRPNGFLWVQAARFTPSRVELWVERTATGTVRYYRLEPVGRTSDDVSGLQDREAFAP